MRPCTHVADRLQMQLRLTDWVRAWEQKAVFDSSSVSAWAAPSDSTKLASTLSTARMPCAHAAMTVTDRLGACLGAESCVGQ